MKKVLFFLLLPFYGIMILILNNTMDWWTKLLE